MLKRKWIFFITLIVKVILIYECGFSYSWEYAAKNIDGNILVMQSLDNNRQLYVSTDKGIFLFDEMNTEWKEIEIPSGVKKVSDIGIGNNELYIVSDNGIYERGKDMSWHRILKKHGLKGMLSFRSDEKKENIVAWSDKEIFYKKQSWEKLNKLNIDVPIGTLAFYGNSIYLSDRDRIMKSEDMGNTWIDIINLYTNEYEDNEGTPQDEEFFSIDRECINPYGEDICTITTDRGIFVIGKDTRELLRIDTTGLPSDKVRIALGTSRGIFAATNNRVFFYPFDKDEWIPVFDSSISEDITSMVLFHGKDNKKYMMISGEYLVYKRGLEDIFLYTAYDNENKNREKAFNSEVSVNEVQKMAIDYAEVSPEKIKRWRAGAKWKAVMPKVSLSYSESDDDNVEIYKSSTKYYVVTGPRESSSDWSIDLTWDLADIVWNNEQTNIDVRSRLMVQLRDDILEEVTRLYFERKKLINEVSIIENNNFDVYKDSSELMNKKLRIEEVTAYIDALTGGKFSEALK